MPCTIRLWIWFKQEKALSDVETPTIEILPVETLEYTRENPRRSPRLKHE